MSHCPCGLEEIARSGFLLQNGSSSDALIFMAHTFLMPSTNSSSICQLIWPAAFQRKYKKTCCRTRASKVYNALPSAPTQSEQKPDVIAMANSLWPFLAKICCWILFMHPEVLTLCLQLLTAQKLESRLVRNHRCSAATTFITQVPTHLNLGWGEFRSSFTSHFATLTMQHL